MNRVACTGILAACLTAMWCVGCGDNATKEMSKPAWYPKTATWPELEALVNNNNTPDPEAATLDKLARSVVTGDTARVCHPVIGINSPKFQEKIKAFEAAAIPAEFDTPERQAIRKDLIAGLKTVTDACKGKKPLNVLKEEYKKIIELSQKIREIPGQTRPTGSEGDKYAPEK